MNQLLISQENDNAFQDFVDQRLKYSYFQKKILKQSFYIIFIQASLFAIFVLGFHMDQFKFKQYIPISTAYLFMGMLFAVVIRKIIFNVLSYFLWVLIFIQIIIPWGVLIDRSLYLILSFTFGFTTSLICQTVIKNIKTITPLQNQKNVTNTLWLAWQLGTLFGSFCVLFYIKYQKFYPQQQQIIPITFIIFYVLFIFSLPFQILSLIISIIMSCLYQNLKQSIFLQNPQLFKSVLNKIASINQVQNAQQQELLEIISSIQKQLKNKPGFDDNYLNNELKTKSIKIVFLWFFTHYFYYKTIFFCQINRYKNNSYQSYVQKSWLNVYIFSILLRSMNVSRKILNRTTKYKRNFLIASFGLLLFLYFFEFLVQIRYNYFVNIQCLKVVALGFAFIGLDYYCRAIIEKKYKEIMFDSGDLFGKLGCVFFATIHTMEFNFPIFPIMETMSFVIVIIILFSLQEDEKQQELQHFYI